MTPPDAPPARELAAAKLNLALHVRARRADGYHLLETLFAFCLDGDRLSGAIVPGAPGLDLAIEGPFAAALADDESNLVRRAHDALAARLGPQPRVAVTLDKRLPVASGIGGGSADAAAMLRLLVRLWRCDPAHATAVAPGLGADVPACLLSLTARGEGVGEALTPLADPGIAGTPVLLLNPGVPLATRDVFACWDGVDRGPLGEDWRSARNDLEAPACALVPAIGDRLDWLGTRPGATLARMSGSGATCFALFADEPARDVAAAAAARDWPGDWTLATTLR